MLWSCRLRRRQATGVEAGGAAPATPPKKVGLDKSRLLGRLVRREAADGDKVIMGDMEYRKRKGGSAKARKGLAFTLRAQT